MHLCNLPQQKGGSVDLDQVERISLVTCIMNKPLTIALAGVGDLGRYLLEELSSDDRYHVAVLTRQKDRKYDHPRITAHSTDYSEKSVFSILNSTGAHALISTVRCPDADYVPLHQGFLNACSRSSNCKRFIPSEWAGNIEDYPHLPGAYGKSRAPFRQILREQSQGVEWTSFNHGWFMDYFVGEDKSYMKYLPGEFPITLKTWEYVVRGTGDEPQSWTCGRDVAKAVAELLVADEQWSPFTKERMKLTVVAISAGRPFSRRQRTKSDIQKSLQEHKDKGDESEELALAEGEEWQISGATACPEEKTRQQREKYFTKVRFLSIEELLKKAENGCV
ncbi:MAG: hypothetical protein M1836_004127 [Candelina mexicana]|nr:MAG: hypothetical protein M1836_004127 [Candelina mexicana]